MKMKGKITMDEIIYRAIANKLNQNKNEDKVNQIMEEYKDDYIKQFTLYKLDNLDFTNPDIDDLILFLIYYVKREEINNKQNIDRIYNDLIDKYERGAITSLDIKDVIYNIDN